jgi:hypothetical protein
MLWEECIATHSTSTLKRLQWTLEHQNWTLEQWKVVAWFDESLFLSHHVYVCTWGSDGTVGRQPCGGDALGNGLGPAIHVDVNLTHAS